jgi:chromosome segregation ATPase
MSYRREIGSLQDQLNHLLGQVWFLEKRLVHLTFRKKMLRWEAQQEDRALDQIAYRLAESEINAELEQIKTIEIRIAHIQHQLNSQDRADAISSQSFKG